MRLQLRLATLALAALVIYLVVRGFTPYDWHGQLTTPPGVPGQSVVVTCAAFWGSSTKAVPVTQYPISGTPCGDRDQLRVTTGADVLLGVGGIAVVAAVGRRRAREDEASHA